MASTWRWCCRPRTTPIEDNGIKFFAGDGYKLSDETELADRAELERAGSDAAGAGGRYGRSPPADRPRARVEGRGRGLPARAAQPLRRARPERVGRAARLRERRHPPRRAGDLPAAGREGDRDRRSAGRAQHQRRLRLDARRAAGRAGPRGRARGGVRLRRRRRPRAGGRPDGDGRRRRRADGARGAAPARAGASERRGRGR